MNRKKQNDPIYYFKESSEEISKNKNKTNYNYFQKTSKKAEYKTFFPNEQKIESYKTKSKKASDKASTKETINQPQISKAQNKNNNINNNDINKTPKRIKRKISNESNKKEKENNDSKLKDSISRCSKISYLNEYSLTNELSETTLPIIKAKLMAQKIFYLYAMCIYNQEKIKSNNENNKKYNKENAKQR